MGLNPEHGQNPNQIYREFGGKTALHIAAVNGHLAVVHILAQSGVALDKFDQSQNTALTLAIAQEHNDVVKYLIQAGCSTSLKVPYYVVLSPTFTNIFIVMCRVKVV